MITIEEFKKKQSETCRLIGLDLGSKRIGVSICDEKQSIATPLKTLNKTSLEHLVNELKIIINDQKDIDFAIELKQEIVNKYQKLSSKEERTRLDKKYYLQPAWKNDNGFSLTIDFVKNNPSWSLSLQTHK